jgi:hypothetical protein
MEGYAAEMTRETAATLPFIRSIAPDSPLLLIWSGDGKPVPAALAEVQKAGLPSYGGGGLSWQSGPLSLAELSPALRPTEWGIQVLTPLTGELFARSVDGEAPNLKISDGTGSRFARGYASRPYRSMRMRCCIGGRASAYTGRGAGEEKVFAIRDEYAQRRIFRPRALTRS